MPISIKDIEVSAFKVPAEEPESDGTLQWESTTLVLVEISAGGEKGIGYTYANQSAGILIESLFKDRIIGADCLNIPSIWLSMAKAIRNQGNCGVAYMAISAVDNALWDLKSKLLNLSLIKMIGMANDTMPVYGSGGFTSYSLKKLSDQLGEWSEQGIKWMKIKVGRKPEEDVDRVKAACKTIDSHTELLVDANGAYSVKQAVGKAKQFSGYGVTWFEEPVSSDDLSGLRFIREKTPPSMEVAAGEYGYHLTYFNNMLSSNAVDVLQADATRCGGITGFLQAGTVCKAYHRPFSSHTAPSLHLHAGPALSNFRHAEYFYDHVRIEQMLFDGVQKPINGAIRPDLSRPGLGLEFKHRDAEKYKV